MANDLPLKSQAGWPAQPSDTSAKRARRPVEVANSASVSALKLIELRNDDGHLVGWMSLAEAAAAALLRLAGGAQ